MEDILKEVRSVELTGLDRVIVRNALRLYVASMMDYVKEAMDDNKYAAVVVHERSIADAIKIFGKVM